jgi:AcrR family transcriptional regulator
MPPMVIKQHQSQKTRHRKKQSESDHRAAFKLSTREKIIEAATTVFSDFPYYAASIRMVGKEANIDHPLINYYFPTKALLFEEVLRQVIGEYYQAHLEWFDGLFELGPEQGLSLYIDRLLEFSKSHPNALRIILLNLVQAEGSDIIPGYTLIREFFKKTMQTFIEAIPLKGSVSDIQKLTTSFNTLAINFLGANTYHASILGMTPHSKEYLRWVKDSMMFMILPRLKQIIG